MHKTILALAAAGALAIAGAAHAQKRYDPGARDTEIKLGQTMPYSGPASAYGSLGRTQVAYFRMVNEQGGINGRRINLISLDDGYSPAKTLESTRRLVEQDEVLLITGSVGTPTNSAIHTYLNQKKVPHLFINTGRSASFSRTTTSARITFAACASAWATGPRHSSCRRCRTKSPTPPWTPRCSR
jgi:ABC-type branched-subunit amino acid transport system substrate-binding protein